jgi:hypothetical protein
MISRGGVLFDLEQFVQFRHEFGYEGRPAVGYDLFENSPLTEYSSLVYFSYSEGSKLRGDRFKYQSFGEFVHDDQDGVVSM